MIAEDKKLDNPVWHSLSEIHRNFAIDYNQTKFYQPDYCPFGAFSNIEGIEGAIDAYSNLADNFFIVGEKPSHSNSLTLKKELVCDQMIIHHRINADIKDEIIKLTKKDATALFQLVNLVQPGYFRTNTFLLGDYYGIFKDDQLLAVAGERLKMNNYTEISAVVTHPNHTGNGYAKQLVAHVVNNVFNQDKTPYLHVAETNTSAIRLYEKLGFLLRRKISFWNLVKS